MDINSNIIHRIITKWMQLDHIKDTSSKSSDMLKSNPIKTQL